MTQATIPRKYFSGGTEFSDEAMSAALHWSIDAGMIPQTNSDHVQVVEVRLDQAMETEESSDKAMILQRVIAFLDQLFGVSKMKFLVTLSRGKNVDKLRAMINETKRDHLIETVYYPTIGSDFRTVFDSTDAITVIGVDKNFNSLGLTKELDILKTDWGATNLRIKPENNQKLVIQFHYKGKERKLILYQEDIGVLTPNKIPELQNGYDFLFMKGIPGFAFSRDFLFHSFLLLKKGGLILENNLKEGLTNLKGKKGFDMPPLEKVKSIGPIIDSQNGLIGGLSGYSLWRKGEEIGGSAQLAEGDQAMSAEEQSASEGFLHILAQKLTSLNHYAKSIDQEFEKAKIKNDPTLGSISNEIVKAYTNYSSLRYDLTTPDTPQKKYSEFKKGILKNLSDLEGLIADKKENWDKVFENYSEADKNYYKNLNESIQETNDFLSKNGIFEEFNFQHRINTLWKSINDPRFVLKFSFTPENLRIFTDLHASNRLFKALLKYGMEVTRSEFKTKRSPPLDWDMMIRGEYAGNNEVIIKFTTNRGAMPKDIIESILNEGPRVSNDEIISEGGLPGCRKTVLALQGKMEIESNETEGTTTVVITLPQLKEVPDAAMNSLDTEEGHLAVPNANTRGGIDLNPVNMNLQTKMDSRFRGNDSREGGNDSRESENNSVGDGNGGIKFHLDPAMLRQLQNASGFVPVIIKIQPVKNLRQFLGIIDA